jgi:hypothetical protein
MVQWHSIKDAQFYVNAAHSSVCRGEDCSVGEWVRWKELRRAGLGKGMRENQRVYVYGGNSESVREEGW